MSGRMEKLFHTWYSYGQGHSRAHDNSIRNIHGALVRTCPDFTLNVKWQRIR